MLQQHSTSDIRPVDADLRMLRMFSVGAPFAPGDLVYHDLHGINRTFGIVVATKGSVTTVLWSRSPGAFVAPEFPQFVNVSWVTNPVDPRTLLRQVLQ